MVQNKSILKKVLNDFYLFLFPEICIECKEILEEDQKFLCKSCSEKIRQLPKENCCLKCNLPLTEKEKKLCYQCEKSEFYFYANYSPFIYEGIIKERIKKLKFEQRTEYTIFFARNMIKYAFFVRNFPIEEIDYITYIPMDEKEYLQREINISELLCKEISKITNLNKIKLLKKKRGTKRQSELKYRERRENLKETFAVLDISIKDKVICIIDDIYTTGTTINECAKKLRQKGARKIISITACRSNIIRG